MPCSPWGPGGPSAPAAPSRPSRAVTAVTAGGPGDARRAGRAGRTGGAHAPLPALDSQVSGQVHDHPVAAHPGVLVAHHALTDHERDHGVHFHGLHELQFETAALHGHGGTDLLVAGHGDDHGPFRHGKAVGHRVAEYEGGGHVGPAAHRPEPQLGPGATRSAGQSTPPPPSLQFSSSHSLLLGVVPPPPQPRPRERGRFTGYSFSRLTVAPLRGRRATRPPGSSSRRRGR